MNEEEYYSIIANAERLDRVLINLDNEENIDRLEGILNEHSKKQGETMIGVPLVQPYGGPTYEYVILAEKLYRKMKASMVSKEIGNVNPEIGVPYDKRRFEINREDLKKRRFDIKCHL